MNLTKYESKLNKLDKKRRTTKKQINKILEKRSDIPGEELYRQDKIRRPETTNNFMTATNLTPAIKQAVKDALRNKGRNNAFYWALINRNFEGKPYRFNYIRDDGMESAFHIRLEPWYDFLLDESPDIFVYKCRKVTYSEQALTKLMFWLDRHPYTHCAIVMPQEKPHCSDFSMQRLDPLIQESSFSERVHINAVLTKGFIDRSVDPPYEQFLYFIGANVARKHIGEGAKARSKALDFMLYDEIQDMPIDARSVIGQAMGSSRYAYSLSGGTPNVKGGILDRIWSKSDQKLFLYKCPGCGKWQQLWKKNLIRLQNKLAYIGCQYCSKSLEEMRGLRIKGQTEWVPQNRNKQFFSGYRFNRLMLGLHPTSAICKALDDPTMTEKKKETEIWGESYSSGDQPFSRETMLLGCRRDFSKEDALQLAYCQLCIGVDWGKPTYYAIYGRHLMDDGSELMIPAKYGALYGDENKHGIEIVRDCLPFWEDLRLKYGSQNMHKRLIVINDFGYSTGRYNHLIEGFGKSSVWGVDYGGVKQRTQKDQRKYSIRRIDRVLGVERNHVIEELAHCVAMGKQFWWLPYKDEDYMDDVITHFVNIIRVDVEKEMGDKEIKIKTGDYEYKRIGSDHYAQCTVYAHIAFSYLSRHFNFRGIE